MERLCTNMWKMIWSMCMEVLNFGLLGQAGRKHVRRFRKNLHIFGGVLLCSGVLLAFAFVPKTNFLQFWNLFLTNDDTKQSYSSRYSYLACTRFSSLHRVPLRKYMWTLNNNNNNHSDLSIYSRILRYPVYWQPVSFYTPVPFHIVFGRHWLGDQK